MLQNPGFYCNSELCTGCKTCMIACKDKHNLGKGQNWRKVLEYCGGGFTPTGNGAFTHTVFAYYLSLSCNHCDDAACIRVCQAKAIHKDENGIVCIDPQRCQGCRSCELDCPYAAPQFDEESGTMTKCDFCKDYLEADMPPACVAACPCRALDFGELADLQAKYGEAAPIAPLPSPELTRPRFFYTPNRQAKALGTTFGTHGALASNPQEL